MELNLKNLAPLLQCTFIYRCALFITSKRKKYYFIKFLSPLLLKKYFSFFFLLSLSLSGFSSFFLFPSHFFFSPSSTLCFAIADLHHFGSSSSPIFIINLHRRRPVAVPRRWPISPSSNSSVPRTHRSSMLGQGGSKTTPWLATAGILGSWVLDCWVCGFLGVWFFFFFCWVWLWLWIVVEMAVWWLCWWWFDFFFFSCRGLCWVMVVAVLVVVTWRLLPWAVVVTWRLLLVECVVVIIVCSEYIILL